MASKNYVLTPEIADYIQSVSLREPSILQRLRKETQQMDEGVMQVSPELGQFMRLLIKLTGSKNILEIGVFTGYSTLSMASAIPEQGRIVACDISDEWTSIARKYWEEAGVQHKIDLHLAPALQTLKELEQQGKTSYFDLVFVDADKANYPAYYELCIELLRPNGLMLIDNTLWGFKVADPNIVDLETNAIQKLNRKLSEDDRVDISMLLFGDGLTMLRKR
ncbi:MAG: class I SAM-dependent methyltransferase [Saprospiraceae bacterium]|nr:class I SAM-dependent methyltransferase [Saprospiraceae bacterium]